MDKDNFGLQDHIFAGPWLIPQRITSPNPPNPPNEIETAIANESCGGQPHRQRRHALDITAPTHIQGHINTFGNLYAHRSSGYPVIQINDQVPSPTSPTFGSLSIRSRVLPTHQRALRQSPPAIGSLRRSTSSNGLEQGGTRSDLPSEVTGSYLLAGDASPSRNYRSGSGSQNIRSTAMYQRRGEYSSPRRCRVLGSRRPTRTISTLSRFRSATAEEPVVRRRPAYMRRVALRERIRRK